MIRIKKELACVCLALFLITASVAAQTTEFTYQGSLKNSGMPANGNFDFEFALYDMLSGGSQVGSTVMVNNVAVANGIFTVKLDFGNQFTGADRFMEIRVRPTGQPGITTLSPRQLMNSAPYSVKSLNTTNADTATNATQLGGVAASQYVVTTDPRMTDERNPTAGSGNYIQNQNAGPQSSSNFNVSGTGTANIFNAATQYNIAGSRILSNAGVNNLFAGVSAGALNTGGGNSFFGAGSGDVNQNGGGNSFFGTSSGGTNQTGNANSFFGGNSGVANQSGNENSFFGSGSGFANKSGGNSFFGTESGFSNEAGANNSFFGIRSGMANTTGSSNTAIGSDADVGAGNLSFATAVGSGSVVSTSNTIALGRSSGVDTVVIPGLGGSGDTALCRNAGKQVATCSSLSVPAGSTNYIQNQNAGPQSSSNFNVSGTGTANIFSAGTQFNIGANRILSNAGVTNLFAGVGAGNVNTGSDNSFFGASSGNSNQTGGSNSFFGASSGIANQTGVFNSFFGRSSGAANQTGDENSFFGSLSGFTSQNGSGNSFFGAQSGYFNETGSNNAFFGRSSGRANTIGSSNTMIGVGGGDSNTTGSFNTVIGSDADVGAGNLTNATAIGNRALALTSNSLVLGSINGVNSATADTNVGIGTTAPKSRLHVNGTGWFSGDTTPLPGAAGAGVGIGNVATFGYLFGFDYTTNTPRDMTINLPGGNVGIAVVPSDTLHVGGIIRVDTLGAAGATTLCRNASNQISTCSSSQRYKTNIGRFSQGMSFVNKLSPISYDWKDGGMKDVGFGAEDIAKIDPRFVTYNSKGDVEGVKYDRLSVAFVNAFKEQQDQIETLQKVNMRQQQENDALKKQVDDLVTVMCSIKADAEICKAKGEMK